MGAAAGVVSEKQPPESLADLNFQDHMIILKTHSGRHEILTDR